MATNFCLNLHVYVSGHSEHELGPLTELHILHKWDMTEISFQEPADGTRFCDYLFKLGNGRESRYSVNALISFSCS